MGSRALRPHSSPPAHVHSSEGARRAMWRLCSPSCLPPLRVCLTDSKQPEDSLSEHAWWYTAVTKSHSKLLASGRRPGICLEDTPKTLRRAWRHSSEVSLDTSKVSRGQMGSQALHLGAQGVADQTQDQSLPLCAPLPAVSNISELLVSVGTLLAAQNFKEIN